MSRWRVTTAVGPTEISAVAISWAHASTSASSAEPAREGSSREYCREMVDCVVPRMSAISLLGPPIRSQFTSDLHLPPPEPSVPVPSEHDRPQTPNLFNSPQFQCILHFEILSVG